MRCGAPVFMVFLFCFVFIIPVSAQEHTSLVISYAQFDVFKQRHTSPEMRFELRQDLKSTLVHPLVGIMGNLHGARYYYFGAYVDLNIVDGLYLTPSFAPGFYSRGKSKNLHFVLEFRSQLDISFNFTENYRLGVNINHISNASLSRLNPGVESIALYILIPFNSIF